MGPKAQPDIKLVKVIMLTQVYKPMSISTKFYSISRINKDGETSLSEQKEEHMKI